MIPDTSFSVRLDAALTFAVRAHGNQVRKGTDLPYIVHPVHVALILRGHGFGEDLVVAGLLHDTVEDCAVTVEDLRGDFGDAVAALVAGVSERKTEHGVRRPWRVRKEEQLAHLARADRDTAALKAADALHNVCCTVADLREHGEQVWSRFNAGRDDALWYYGELTRICGGLLGDHPLAAELRAAVDALRRA